MGMDRETVRRTVVELLERAEIELPRDVMAALEECDTGGSGLDDLQISMILENVALARDRGTPMCEDTGTPVFYVRYGDVPLPLHEVVSAIREGVIEATGAVPLRPNSVHPLTRLNQGENAGQGMPPVHVTASRAEAVEIAVMAKGAGSENMSALAMLPPASGTAGIVEFVLETVLRAGGNPCPPVIIGVGLGGTSDTAMALAKRALLRPMDTFNQDPKVSHLEAELRVGLRDLGIGPMGLGGSPTVIGVNVEYSNCHPASLPVGVNIQCWAARSAVAIIAKDGTVDFVGGKR